MGPKAGGKKAKGLTPEEIAAKEEEARKEREKEEKRLAEEQRLRELEEAKLKAEMKAVREEEFNRLNTELQERTARKEKCALRKQKSMAIQVRSLTRTLPVRFYYIFYSLNLCNVLSVCGGGVGQVPRGAGRGGQLQRAGA